MQILQIILLLLGLWVLGGIAIAAALLLFGIIHTVWSGVPPQTFWFLLIISLVGTYWAAIKICKKYNIKLTRRKNKETFGKARFSEREEIKSAGLQQRAGIVYGQVNKKLVEKSPDLEGHSVVFGGTRSGKSAGCAIPTLLRWPGAVVAVDIKGELSRITADHRRTLGPVYIFDPEDPGGHTYDPIKDCIALDQAQELSRALIPRPDKGDPFWADAAQGILAAGAMQGAHIGMKLADVAESLCSGTPDSIIKNFRNSEIRAVRMLVSTAADAPEKTMGGVFSQLRSRLITLAADENLDRATRGSEWSAADLERNATIFLRVSERQLKQYRDLWTLILSQLMRHLMGRSDRQQPPVLLLIDEAARIGRLDVLLDGLATLSSKNVHILLLIQSLADLDRLYGRDERKSIADNCGYKLVFRATDPETQTYFSDLAGQKTIMTKGMSSGSHLSLSAHEQGVPLLRPEEWANLEKPILFSPGLQPSQIDKAYWFNIPELKKRGKTD